MFSKFAQKFGNLLSSDNDISNQALALARLILTSIVVTGLVVGIRQSGALEGFELSAFDRMVRSRPDEGLDDRLLVVGVTETDIQTRKEYPLTDSTVLQLLQKLQQHQPRAIGLDIYRDVPIGKGRDDLMKHLKASDRIIAACKVSSTNDPGIASAPGVPEDRVGFADLPLDPGGQLRRILLVTTPVRPTIPVDKPNLCNYPDPENQVVSLGLQLAMKYLQPQGIEAEPAPSGEIKLGAIVLRRIAKDAGGYQNADADKDYQMLLNYRSASNATKQVTLTDVLQDKIAPALVKDKVVLIGYTSPNAKDDFYTPYSAGLRDNQKMPGVVVHAQVVSQILSAVLNNRPLIGFWPEWGEILWIGGWSLLAGIIAWKIKQPLLFAVAGGVILIVLVGISYSLFLQAIWIPLVSPTLAAVGTAGAIVLLDRGYAKAIYTGVKKVLKIEIEIDEDKKQRDLDILIQSESFRILQAEAEALRNNASTNTNQSPQPQPDELRNIENDSSSATNQSSQAQSNEPTPELDYFEQLRQKAQEIKDKDERS